LVVVLGGSKAGIPTIGKSLSDYLTMNYSVLLMVHFGVGSLPRTLERVPVEYFVNAVKLALSSIQSLGFARNLNLSVFVSAHQLTQHTIA
jgi:hypothetical protein